MGKNQRSQITMTDEEVDAFITQTRTATMATIGPTGAPHLVAMWFAWFDGCLWFETKAKSQKAVNLRRDPRITVSLESGWTYDTLRGVAIDGVAEVIDDAEVLFKVGVDVWERYNGPYSEEVKPLVELMLNNRVAVRVEVQRVRSWDHSKLGMPTTPLGGSTAAFLPRVGED